MLDGSSSFGWSTGSTRGWLWTVDLVGLGTATTVPSSWLNADGSAITIGLGTAVAGLASGLPLNTTAVFTLLVTSSTLASSSAIVTHSVYRAGLPLPQVSVIPPLGLPLLRPSHPTFSLNLVASTCGTVAIGVTTIYGFAWSVVGVTTDSLVLPSSTSTTSRDLVLPVGVLIPGETYTATVRVIASTSAGVAIATYTFTVGSSALVAVMTGGARQRPANTAIVVDASGSYDPDATSGGPLTFAVSWLCVLTSSAGICDTSSWFGTNTLSIMIPANALTAGVDYTITCMLTSGVRTASVSVILTALASTEYPAPRVSLSGAAILNSDSTLRLQALVQSLTTTTVAQMQYSWIEIQRGLQLVPAILDSPNNTASLVIAAGVLVPQKTYTFMVVPYSLPLID